LKKRFFETFSAENYIFSQHFWGKIFRGIFPEIFPGKKCTKNRPLIEKFFGSFFAMIMDKKVRSTKIRLTITDFFGFFALKEMKSHFLLIYIGPLLSFVRKLQPKLIHK
jgi:hypothetical protein